MAKKEIVYSIVFDNSSFNRAMSQLQALENQFKKLNQSGGGLMGDGGGFGLQKTQTSRRAGRPASVGQPSIGIPQGLTKALQDQKTLLGGFEREISSVFRGVNRTVSESVATQIAALDRLEKKLASVATTSKNVGGNSIQGPGGPGFRDSNVPGWPQQDGITGAQQRYNQRVTRHEDMGTIGRGVAGFATTGLLVSGALARNAPYELNRDAASYGQAIRTPAMAMLGYTGQGIAFSQALRDNREKYNAQRRSSWIGSDVTKAKTAAEYKAAYQAAIEKNKSEFSLSNVFEAIAQDSSVGKRGGGWERFGRTVGTGLSTSVGIATGRSTGTEMLKIDQEANKENLQDVQNTMLADPRRYMGANRLGEGVFERARMQSKLRLGNRDKVKFRRDPKTGRVIRGGGIMDVEDNLFENALSLSDLAAGQDSIVATGGLRAAIKRRGLSMLATRGGYGDAGSIIGSLAKMGQDPSRFLHQVSGMRSFGNPKVGFDEQAGNDLAKAIASQVNQGATSVSAEAALRVAMGGMRSIGGSDMYRQEALAQGGAYLGDQVFAGNLDPLQKARNYKHALQAFGGNAAIARYVSENPNAQTMMEQAAAGGKMDSFFQQMGMSEAQYKAGMAQYGNLTFGNNFRGVADYSSSIPEDSPMGKMRKMLEQGGFGMDFGRLAKSKGWQGEELVKHAETAAQLYRLNQIADGSPMDDKTARGAIGRMVARISPEDKTLELAGFKGGPAAQERAILEGKNALNREAANQAAAFSPEELKNIKDAGNNLYDLGGKLGMSMKDFDRGLQNTAALLDQLNSKLEGTFGLGHQMTAEEIKSIMEIQKKLSAPYTGGGKK